MKLIYKGEGYRYIDIPKEIAENLYSRERVLYRLRKRLGMKLKPKFLVIIDRRVIYFD